MITYKKNQTVSPLVFLIVDNADHVTPVTGLTPTVTLSKNGAAFAAAAGAVTEIGNGWYQVTPDADDFDTIGPLILRATAVGVDITNALSQVTSGLVDLGPTQLVDIVGNVQGSVGSVLSPVTCKKQSTKCC